MHGLIRRLPALGLLLALSGCGHNKDGPAPSKTADKPALQPQAVCIEQLTTTVTIEGEFLSPLPTKVLTDNPELVLPEIALLLTKDLEGGDASGSEVIVPDDPAAPGDSHVAWESQEKMTFEIFPELTLSEGLYSVRATNANGQAATWADALLAVPRPTIEDIEPDLLCAPKGGTVDITGKMMIHDGDSLPKVTATAEGGDAIELPPPLLDACTQLPGGSGFEACEGLQVTVAGDKLPADEPYKAYSLQVANPDPVGCHSTDEITLTMVPAPVLEKVEPELICSAQKENTLTLTGKGFLRVGDQTPQVAFGGEMFASSVDGCQAVPNTKTPVESCTTLTVTIPQGGIDAGSYAVTVINPTPADCQTSEPINMVVVPPPVVDEVQPGVICEIGDDDMEVSVIGSGFITIDTGSGTMSLPEVTINGETFTDPTPADCVPIEGLVATVQTCGRLVVSVPKDTLEVGNHPVTVTNPPPADCSSEGTLSLRVVDPPTVTGVVPAKLCVGGGSLAVTGTNFFDGISVTVGNTDADLVTVTSETEVSATFGAVGSAGGPYDLTVGYSESCKATLPQAVTVVPGPQLFFADPPVTYNGIELQITLYGSGFTGALDSIAFRPAGTADAPTELTFTYDPAKPNQVQAVVPAQTPAGDYDVILQDQTNCDAILVGGLTVVDQVTLQITSIVPPFGHTDATTAVTVFADDTVGGGFKQVPRLYLNPTAGGQAAAIGAVAFVDATRVTALVPKGLPVDTYDLIAVNPDGGVGLLSQGFKVTAMPPPTLTGITPGSVINNAGQAVKVEGSDIRNPTASMRCIEKGSTGEVEQAVPVGSFDDGEANLTVDASPYQLGAVCVVRITNDDGTYGEIPGLVITNPSQNLSMFANGPTMAVARRALSAIGNRATLAARFVYVIGGDTGNTNDVLDSVEVAPVDIFGMPGDFFTQRNKLVKARGFANVAAVDRCIYVAGGTDGATALDSVERACVLDPADRPMVTDLTLDTTTDPAEGLDPGVWYYQVAAVMPADHPTNPGGETLPSEPFPLLVPQLQNRKLTVTVHWSLVPGAVGYRVYRSPAANAAADALELLASVDSGAATSHVDLGAATQPGAPHKLGATGTWHTLAATLGTPRQGPGVAEAPDPGDATGQVRTLYVFGGQDGSSALTSYERLSVTINADGSQTVGAAFIAGSEEMSKGRWQLQLWSVGNANASYVSPPTHFIYAGGGVASNGTSEVDTVDVFEVQPGGELGAPVAVDTMQPSRAGYGYAAANNFLYAFGGNKAMPDMTCTSIRICVDDSVQQCTGGPPELENWNNANAHLVVDRYLMGSAVQSGFIYVFGGSSTGASATATTEYSNW